MNPKSNKHLGDNQLCPKCKKLKMHHTETDDYVEEWCSSCDYVYKFKKNIIK
jgi:rubredoxin